MAFQLHEQRENWDDPNRRDEDVAAYFGYLDSVRAYLPENAHAIATNRRWYGFDDYGPHDSEFVKMVLSDEPDRTDIAIFLRGGEIKEIRYQDVLRYDLSTRTGEDPLHGSWRFDEFSLSGRKEFCHTIQWSGGRQWVICAREIEVIR